MKNFKLTHQSFGYVRKIVLGASFTLLVTIGFAASAMDYSKAERELRIMDKIFEASLIESKHKANHFSFGRKNRSTYLAEQGMVFSFDFNNNQFGGSADWQALGEGIGKLVGNIANEVTAAIGDIDVAPSVAPVSPSAPHAVPYPDGEWNENIEAFETYQENIENLREAQRDQRQEVRDLQRSIRDIERQTRDKKDDKKELTKTKKELESRMKELANKTKDYEKSMHEYRQKKLQELKQRNQKKSDSIIGTLCDYGSTLKSLKNGEHVTIIFNDYENNKDQVYVFSFKDVKNCSNKQSLLKKAISYQL